MNKKIGGIVMRQVVADLCACGKTHAECAEWWDKFLGITTNAADSYFENLAKQRKARMEGHDVYCAEANRRASGYVSHWTPKAPDDTLSAPKYTAIGSLEDSARHTGGANGKASGGGGDRRKRGSRKTARGSGRRKRGKSVRRKR